MRTRTQVVTCAQPQAGWAERANLAPARWLLTCSGAGEGHRESTSDPPPSRTRACCGAGHPQWITSLRTPPSPRDCVLRVLVTPFPPAQAWPRRRFRPGVNSSNGNTPAEQSSGRGDFGSFPCRSWQRGGTRRTRTNGSSPRRTR